MIEAGEGSGALHTANWAFEQGRDVFAIPGSVFSRQSQGTNQLIRENTARLVATPEQLCEELNLLSVGEQMPLTNDKGPPAPFREAPSTTADEQPLLARLAEGSLHIDELARVSGLPIAQVSSTLQIMELKGLVRQTGPMLYARA